MKRESYYFIIVAPKGRPTGEVKGRGAKDVYSASKKDFFQISGHLTSDINVLARETGPHLVNPNKYV